MGVRREGAERPVLAAPVRWALAALVSCVALLVFAPGALAAEGSGAISGQVTAAGTHENLGGIEVIAYEADEGLPVGFASTRANGEYTVTGLAGGSYVVEFSAGFESGLNYVTQYWDDAASFADATHVSVAEGDTREGIDAELEVGGRIEGVVTQACACELLLPLKNIEVAVYEEGDSKVPVGYAVTGKHGEYTVEGLANGKYVVQFSASESGQNFIAQYYDRASSFATANPVKVVQGSTAKMIDAELEVGGEISGRVTDASTHAPVENIVVAALDTGETVYGIAFTNANGEYTIPGLTTGSYEVGFAGAHYVAQYYNDESSLAKANPVSVVQGEVAAGIDAALVPKAPVNTVAPVASGTPAVGQTLSCSTGSWTGSPAPTYAYAWLRDGVAIAGASASGYLVQTADQGNGLTCKVTATNKNGSASAVSNTLTVPVPVPPPAVPVLTLSSARIVVSGNAARVSVSCANTICAGTIELTAQVAARHRHGRRAAARRRTIVLGRASYALTAGQNATIVVRLTGAGKRALAAAKHHRLSAKLLASVTGGARVQSAVVLSEAAAKHGGRR